MKRNLTPKSIAVLFLLTGGLFLTSCKKEKTVITPDKTELKTTVDGVAFQVAESGLNGNIYTDAGDAVKSVELNAALDASGRKFTFFVNDLKSGKIILDPKTGTSALPHPSNAFMQRLQTIDRGFMAGQGSGVQNYMRYEFGGNSYYAYSGFIEITYEPQTGKIAMNWSVSFKDAAGKEFTSSGSFVIYIKALETKPKSEVKDPTPVSATPAIENISPTTGFDGTEISITGTNFSTTTAENVVKINNVNATVKSATATKLVITAPAGGSTGAITVKVKNSAVTTGPVFTYALPSTFTGIAPATAKIGEEITISGTNFNTDKTKNEVKFVSAATGVMVTGTVKTASATALVVQVPVGAVTGVLIVSAGGKDATRAANFSGLFTLNTQVTPPTTDFGKRGQVYLINATPSAIDADGNIYTYDDNQQLTKREHTGEVIKVFTKNDFSGGIPALNSYKVTAMAADQNGKVYFHMHCSTWPNGEVKTYMVSQDADGKLKKEFETTFLATSYVKMVVSSVGDFYLAYDDSIYKMTRTGNFGIYLKGLAGGEFEGNGAYDLGIGMDENLYVLSYVKGANTSAIPTNQVIYKFTPGKIRSTVFANINPGYEDGAIATARFNDIRCIAVSGLDVYVGDHGNFRIRKLSTRTGMVTTIAGNGKQYDPNNNNMPTPTGGLLNVNIFRVRNLVYDNARHIIYGGANQKFVLN